MGPFGAGRELRNSFRLSPSPPPKDVRVNGASARSFTLMGRSVRNCRRLSQKLSGTMCEGGPKDGTAVAGTGTAGSALPGEGFRLVILGGRRVMIESGTVNL